MKQFLLTVLIFSFCYDLTEAQSPTFAGVPGPENVLVVYNLNSDTSALVANYYKNARGIPQDNILPLDSLPEREPLTYNGEEHIIKIVQSGDIIQDSTQAEIDSAQSDYQSSFHAWFYFYNHIATKIKDHLEITFVNGVPLKETIRYIVLCKGVPYKIQAMGDWDGLPPVPPNKNVSLQSLIALLNNEPYLTTLETLFFSYINRTNPYYMEHIDDYYYLDYRFLPDFFTYPGGLKLSYLVTRLDGLNFENVTQMIDNAANADTTGLRTWILDGNGYGPPSSVADL